MENLVAILVPPVVLLVSLVLVGFIISRLYKRSTRGISLVRTGAGGLKVVMDGGIFVVPVLHEVTKLNMRTTKLEVKRFGENGLITKDSMRVDTSAEFFVRVQGDVQSIADAAQTLGEKTFDAEALREMVEGKVVDALRSVAATMDMQDLHQNRSTFVQEVQKSLSVDLKANGLMLEAVSLTSLDQTNIKDLDPNNVFNARASSLISQITTAEAMKRAATEAEGKVAIAQSVKDAEIQALAVARDVESARVEQSVELSKIRARESYEAAKENEAAAQIIDQARIDRNKASESAQIESDLALELARQQKLIAISEASEAESVAAGNANEARAAAVEAEEKIATNREIAVAERNKRIQILTAEQQAETAATEIRVRAHAERDAAEDRAASIIAEANAEAQKITILAEANKLRDLAEAEGREALVAAENTVSAEVIAFRLSTSRIEALPAIIREMVEPARHIDSLRVSQITGLPSLGSSATGEVGMAANTGPMGQIFDGIAGMTVQMPLLKALGKEIGMNFDSGVEGVLNDQMTPDLVAKSSTA